MREDQGFWRRYWPLVTVTATLLIAWQLYGALVNPLLAPPPTKVAIALWDLIVSGRLVEALIPSMILLATGFSAAVVVGVILGFLQGRVELAERTFGPYLAALYATPMIALVPILVIWFGYGPTGKFIVVFLMAVFPMYYNMAAGVTNAPVEPEEMARSFGANRWTILSKVVFPSTSFYLFAGLRQSLGRAIIGLVVAEAYLNLGGIGGLIYQAGATFAIDYLIAAIVALPILGLLLTRGLTAVQTRVNVWRPT
jgi:ABC-type nitrate/sulfonate/bicarbonate transport system permease component